MAMDEDIENAVKQCFSCQQIQQTPPSAPLQPWSWPTRPWSHLHIDYAGPLEGKMILLSYVHTPNGLKQF